MLPQRFTTVFLLLSLLLVVVVSGEKTRKTLPGPSKIKGDVTRVMMLPLDERFTTRDLFINMASIVDSYEVLTPPTDIICHWKQPADIPALHAWIDAHISHVDAMILSSEMYLYGGLIASRISNDTLEVISQRLDRLANYKKMYPKLKIYITNVIMRIPAYNADFEEPWYWALYGYDIYLWSFLMDRYHMLGNKSDYEKATQVQKQIPDSVLREFLWRRNRNHQITVQMLQMQQQSASSSKSLFQKIWITLDDNAEYGLNKQEERELRKQITDENLWNQVNMYPGADEVQLTALSFMSTELNNSTNPPKVAIVYRDPSTRAYIPNYEGQPLNVSVIAQTHAAGGVVVSSVEESDVIILVNNWSTEHQQEAPNPQTAADYNSFLRFLTTTNQVIVYADVRYSNGGDIAFSQWIYSQKQPKLGQFTYAGWNTAGNTLGTCISNGILVALFSHVDSGVFNSNAKFQIYRFLEDVNYQATIRTYLNSYLSNVSLDPPNNLDVDAPFYEKFVLKGLQTALQKIQQDYPPLSVFTVQSLYFPWHRPFEIGFQVSKNAQKAVDA